MHIIIFVALSLILAVYDLKSRLIPNLIVLPAIILGCYLTGNWIWAVVMLSIGAVLFKFNIWRGGDAKLLSMVGAFLGWPAIAVFGFTILAIKAYRRMNWDYGPIAVAPIMCFVNLTFLSICYVTKAII